MFTKGNSGHEIILVAKELNADLIVLGTHGYSGWKRFAIGSVEDCIVKYAHVMSLSVNRYTNVIHWVPNKN